MTEQTVRLDVATQVMLIAILMLIASISLSGIEISIRLQSIENHLRNPAPSKSANRQPPTNN